MYVEQTTTGINVMDLSPRQTLFIRDSLIKAANECVSLSVDERQQIVNIAMCIEAEIQENK